MKGVQCSMRSHPNEVPGELLGGEIIRFVQAQPRCPEVHPQYLVAIEGFVKMLLQRPGIYRLDAWADFMPEKTTTLLMQSTDIVIGTLNLL